MQQEEEERDWEHREKKKRVHGDSRKLEMACRSHDKVRRSKNGDNEGDREDESWSWGQERGNGPQENWNHCQHTVRDC